MLMMILIGLWFAIPFYGVIFAAGAFSMIGMVRFQSSYYINREADSTQRATILSFKGLALNIGLGAASILYSGYVAFLRGTEATQPHVNDDVFIKALFSFPSYFLILLTLFFYLVWRYKIYNLHNLNKLEKAEHSISQ
jgi:NADH:ubiquinone oxidoreductase subunit 5 (subunit L)/multisubunit Na+/H+ antiporter MnhA subunit